MRPVVAVVGGFLGAGKTTLIMKAARILRARGVAVAAVLNDQSDGLVDTEFARRNRVPAEEVAGGCFCCRFPDLIDALERLDAYAPEVIFAEAVGSCTDIAATTLRPLLRDYGARYRIAPLTVLIHKRPDDPDLRFLFDLQTAEADLVIDRGVDVDAWLDALFREGVVAAGKVIAVDYERYAQAEAALGWLNARATVRPPVALSPAMILGPLVDEIDGALTAAGIGIAHLKAIAQSESGYVKAALTGNGREPAVEGMLYASPAVEHEVVLNLRALGDPERLREIVERAFAGIPAQEVTLQAFRPAAPVPYQRISG
ncbi:MAG TPA: GTP-binding protein [Bryobacteraceae bacterium]|nr:GTP-binding protein [Bryobacteraceae bacterium]